MAKKSKLLAALDAHQGKDYHVERQKKLQKLVRKAQNKRAANADGADPAENKDDEPWSGIGDDAEEVPKLNGKPQAASAENDSDETDSEDDKDGGVDLSRIDDSDSDSNLEDDVEDEDEVPQLVTNGHAEEDERMEDADAIDVEDGLGEDDDDIPLSELSDLSSTAKEDIIPHQRLTINNTAALLKSLRSFALPLSTMAFSEHQSLTSEEPVSIADIDDDLNRELAFYKQSLDAVTQARKLLKAEDVPFSRPTDYFAEMAKTDEHMGRIKQKLVDEAAGKKAAAEARKLRDLKKFGKQVQVAKLQERDRAKRDTLDKIQMLKKKRKDAPTSEAVHENEDDDMFDVGVERENSGKAGSHGRSHADGTGRRGGERSGGAKRQKRDQKFGFGGKKRFSKSGDAMSSGDLSRFNASPRDRRAGGGGAGAGPTKKKPMVKQKRLGKSRRVSSKAR